MFTITRSLRVRQTVIQLLRAMQRHDIVYCIQGNSGLENSYCPIPRFVRRIGQKLLLGTYYKKYPIIGIYSYVVAK